MPKRATRGFVSDCTLLQIRLSGLIIILLICGLLFSLPYSTGKVERFISSLKLTKTDRRTKLHFSTLNVAHDHSSTSESEPEEETLTVDDWDKWFDTEDSD